MSSRVSPDRVLALALWVLAAACGGASDGGSPAGVDHPRTTTAFARIQTRILTPQCATCHVAGNAAAVQSGLVLDGASAYANLVGATPTNLTARDDRLLRVRPFRSDSSLLYHKLSWVPGHHAHDYGLPMPSGSTTGLSEGQLEYVRRWIDAGASRDGDAIDTTLLDDRSPQKFPAFTPLAPPAAGIQLRVDSFAVRGNFERELFVYRPLGNSADLYVDRIETKMRIGSHHLLLYTYDDTRSPFCALRPPAGQVRDIRNADGSMNVLAMLPMACHVFFGGSMTQTGDFRFPDGVALRVPAGTGIDFNVHYVNKTGAEFPGEAYANLYTVDRSRVQHVARTLNFGNQDIVLPPRQRTTMVKTFGVTDSAITIVALTSHMHARGERFVIRVKGGARDGQVVYENTDWAHPAFVSFASGLVLRRGEALVSEITYYNETDRTITFGLTSEDEMGIIFGYYY